MTDPVTVLCNKKINCVLSHVFRPAFGGNECKGPDIEAELCHQQVSSYPVYLQWASIQQVSTVYSVNHCA